MSEFSECIADGAYTTVKPGEVCSLDTAKKLGIHDSEKYYINGYEDVKTFNETKDDYDRRETELCSETRDGKNAYQFCMIEHGIGFVRKPAYPDKCITLGCPPGFTNERGECKKPLEDYAVSKRARCDERWYDWFMVPNYHLGNKYWAAKPGQCYQPCPAFHVPQYEVDPVDETSGGYRLRQRLDKCVARNSYMSGKYTYGSDYCPLAWVHRLAAIPSVLNEKLHTRLDKLQEKKKPENMNDSFEKLKSGVANEALQIARKAGEIMENIDPPNDNMKLACQKLNTPQRLSFAHETCQRLAEDDSWYAEKLELELGESEQGQREKTKMLKQACNALFCNTSNNEEIGKEPICIQGVEDVKPIENDENSGKPITAQRGQGFFRASVRFAFSIVIVVVIGMLVYLGFAYYIYPKILVPFWRWFKELFTRFKTSKESRMLDEMIEDSK